LKALTGGCSCGEIRYRLTNKPLVVHACHCRDCQRITGGAFVINIWIERQYVEASGTKPKSYLTAGGSGKEHEAFFCGKCGTYVWSRYAIAPGDPLFVRAGTLDDPKAVKPDIHLFTRYKVLWLTLPEGIPAFRSAYNIAKVWPAASLERLRQNVAAQASATKGRALRTASQRIRASPKNRSGHNSQSSVDN
jgi:hypothetical protein